MEPISSMKALSTLLACLLICGVLTLSLLPARTTAAATRVQTKSANSAGYVTTFNMTFDSSTTSGNTIICAVAYNNDTAGTLSLSDNKGNSYSQVVSGSQPDTQAQLYYAANITGGASHQMTATMSANSHDIALICREYSGLSTSPLDKSAGGTTAAGTSHTSATTAATTQANELVVAMVGLTGNATCTAGAGFGNVVSQNGSDIFDGACLEDKDISSTGTQQATITTSGSVATYFIIASFKEASASSVNGVGSGVYMLSSHTFINRAAVSIRY